MLSEEQMQKINISLLRDKIRVRQNGAYLDGRFSLFHVKAFEKFFTDGKRYETMEGIYEILDGWDKSCNLPYEFGMHLSELAEKEEYTICFHRTKLNLDKEKTGLPESKSLVSIMDEGLRNYGHANAIGGSAFTSNSVPGLGLTTTPLVGIGGYVNLVGPYHENDTIVIMVFPSALVDKDGDIRKGVDPSLIYDMSRETPTIKPEFIYGAILKKENGFDEFYTRDQIVQSKDMNSSDQKGSRK